MAALTVTACKSCRAQVVWCRTATGKLMPVDAAPHPDGNITLDISGSTPVATVHGPLEVLALDIDIERFTSHFADCPQSADWRRR